MPWTRITDPETVAQLLPAWFGRRMVGLRGSFGFLLTTGDVLRVTSITAVHQSPEDTMLLDVLLDHAGVPDEVDLAWRAKHFLGAPIPGATLATVNLSQIVAAIEFAVAEMVEEPGNESVKFGDDLRPEETTPATEAVGRETV